MGLVEEQGEEGAVPGSARSSEMWVPLRWTVSFQEVGLGQIGELGHTVERGLVLVPGERVARWQLEAAE